MNINIFNLDVNLARVGGSLWSSGRLLQRVCYVLHSRKILLFHVLTLGTISWLVSVDLKGRNGPRKHQSDILGCNRLVIYKWAAVFWNTIWGFHLVFVWHCYPQTTCVKNLGVFFDHRLSFHQNVKYITRTELFHLRNIAKIRPMWSAADAETIIETFT